MNEVMNDGELNAYGTRWWPKGYWDLVRMEVVGQIQGQSECKERLARAPRPLVLWTCFD